MDLLIAKCIILKWSLEFKIRSNLIIYFYQYSVEGVADGLQSAVRYG